MNEFESVATWLLDCDVISEYYALYGVANDKSKVLIQISEEKIKSYIRNKKLYRIYFGINSFEQSSLNLISNIYNTDVDSDENIMDYTSSKNIIDWINTKITAREFPEPTNSQCISMSVEQVPDSISADETGLSKYLIIFSAVFKNVGA